MQSIFLKLLLYFWLRLGAQGVTLSVCLSVCSAQSCLEHSIFILEPQILHDDFMKSSWRLQDVFRMTSGWLQDDFRMNQRALSKHSESTQSTQRSLRRHSENTSSYRRSLKYFVLFIFETFAWCRANNFLSCSLLSQFQHYTMKHCSIFALLSWSSICSVVIFHTTQLRPLIGQ